jgi:MFS family permease
MWLRKFWNDPINRLYAFALFKHAAFFSAVLVPFFTEWGGISLFQVQLLQSWFSIWVFVLEVPTGALADRIGRKHSISLGSLIIAIAVIVYGLVPNFYIFLLAELIFAIGYAFVSGADQALLFDTLKVSGRESESKKVMGRYDATYLIGMTIASATGSLIASKWGLNAPQFATAIPMLIAAAVGYSIPEPKIHSDSQQKRYLQIVKGGLSVIKKNSVVRSLAIDSVLVASAAYFVVWFYQPVMMKLGIPIAIYGLVHSVLLLSEIVVSSNFPLFERLLGEGEKYLKSSAILVTLSFALMAIMPSMYTLAIFVIIGGGIGYTRAIYITALAQTHIDSDIRATTLSSIGMLRRLALVVLNPVIGAIATNSLYLAIFVVGLLPLLSLLIKSEET